MQISKKTNMFLLGVMFVQAIALVVTASLYVGATATGGQRVRAPVMETEIIVPARQEIPPRPRVDSLADMGCQSP